MQDKPEDQLPSQPPDQAISGTGSGHVQVGEVGGNVVGSVVNHTHVSHLTIIQWPPAPERIVIEPTQQIQNAPLGVRADAPDGPQRPVLIEPKKDVLLSLSGYFITTVMACLGLVVMGMLLVTPGRPLSVMAQMQALIFVLFSLIVSWLSWRFLAHPIKKNPASC
ncbi:MAG: hypothetical protein QM617_04975 [Comamonas sp.]